MHNNGCGDVLSSRAPTAPGMVLQCPRWWHNSGDGRTSERIKMSTRGGGVISRTGKMSGYSGLSGGNQIRHKLNLLKCKYVKIGYALG
jgi:hypothetical protein